MRQVTALPAFTGVAVSSVANVKLPRNRRYHGILLQYKTNDSQANIEAALTQIVIKVNDRVVRDFSAAQLNLINAFNNIAFSLGMLYIPFSNSKTRTPEGEEFLAWLCYESLGIGDVTIDVTISGVAVAPVLSGFAIWDNALPADQAKNPALRTVMHWVKKVVPCSAAGTVSPADHFPAVNGFLHRLHAFDAVVTAISLNQSGTVFFTQTGVQLPALIGPYGQTKQANTMHAPLDYNQQYVDGLYIPSVPNLGADYVASGAATGNQFTVLQEIRKPFDIG